MGRVLQNGKVDFRGSEVMIQRNWYTPGGTRWLDEKAAAYARAEKARGTADEAAYAITASDTVEIFPRFGNFLMTDIRTVTTKPMTVIGICCV